MKKNYIVILFSIMLIGRGPVTPHPMPVSSESQISFTSTPLPSTTPTTAFFNIPSIYVPPATPTFAPVEEISQNLEVILPENIGRLELINRWGKGILLNSKTSPDNKILAVATTTGIYLYQAKDLMQIGYLNVEASNRRFMVIDFSPDSKLLAVAGRGVSLWDVTSQTLAGTIPVEKPLNQPWRIKFTPDGKHIAIEDLTYFCGAAGGVFTLYTIEGYKVFDVSECGPNEAGMDGYYRVVDDRWFYFFNNSRYLDTKTFPDKVIKVDLTTDKIVDVIRNDALQKLYDISPDGKLAAYSIGTKTEKNNSYTITYETKIIDIATGQIRGTPKDQVEFVKKDSGEVIWQVTPYDRGSQTESSDSIAIVRKDKLVFPTDHGLTRYYFDATGSKLIVPSYGTASVLDVKTGDFTYSISSATFENSFSLMGLNLDNSRMILGQQEISPGPFYIDDSRFTKYTLEVVDTTTGKALWSQSPGSRLKQILPGMDNSSMLVEDNLGLHVWNLTNGKAEHSISDATGLYSYPNGQQYIFVAHNQIHIWDAKNWKDLRAFDGGELHYVRETSPVSEHGRIAVLYTLGENPGKDMRVAVFDVNSGKKIIEVADDESGLELMEDQPYFVHNKKDGYIELWSVDQNTPVTTFLGDHTVNNKTWGDYSRNYDDVFLSPDSQIFITSNNGLEFWDVKSGKLLAEISKCTNPLFSPDGRMLVTVGEDGTFWVWGIKRK